MTRVVVILMTPQILPLLSAHGGNIDYIGYEGEVSVFNHAHALIVTPYNKIDRDFIQSLPENIKLIVSIGVGSDHIDLSAATEKGLVVTNTPVVTEDTADLAFSLILAASRRLTANEKYLREGNWSVKNPGAIIGQSVHHKKLGIIGFGAIGQAVARRAAGFNMTVLYYNKGKKIPAAKELKADFCASLEDLLSQVDIVSLHCSLTEETKYIINAHSLKKMKPGSILINTGRGKLVNEADLIEALTTGHISAAGLDVYEDEPHISPGLKDFNTVTLLPHIGSATHECRTEMIKSALRNIRNYFEGNRQNLTKIN